MSEHIYLITITLPMLVVIIIAWMKYYGGVQMKARLAADESQRVLTEKAAAAQAETAAALAAVNANLADVKAHVAAIEKLLRDVE